MIFIENLITLIPEILWILISGYLYLKVFDFVTYEKDTKNYEYIFLKSVVCGTVLYNTVGTLTNMLISPWDNIVFISSVTLVLLPDCKYLLILLNSGSTNNPSFIKLTYHPSIKNFT